MPTTTPNLLKIAGVAERLGLSENTVYAMAQRGDLPAFKVGNGWRVKATDLDAWIDEKAAAAKAASA